MLSETVRQETLAPPAGGYPFARGDGGGPGTRQGVAQTCAAWTYCVGWVKGFFFLYVPEGVALARQA